MRIQKFFGRMPFPTWHMNTESASFQSVFRGDDFEPASLEEKEGFVKKTDSSYWRDTGKRIVKNPVAMASVYVIAALFVFAFIGPLFFENDYTTQLRGMENLSPSWNFPFGTDNLGRDMLVRTMFGTRVSLIVGLSASLIVLVIGSVYGSVSGYFGGKLDDAMMRFVEFVYSVPDILVILLISVVLRQPLINWFNNSSSQLVKSFVVLGPGLIAIFIAFGLLYWVGMARIIRGQVMAIKNLDYVVAARALGATGPSIIVKHILPNCISQIIVMACLQIPTAIFLESFLSFLGLGVSAPMTSLGSLAADAINSIYSYPERLFIPSVILSIMILSLNLFSDALRDALDPYLKN